MCEGGPLTQHLNIVQRESLDCQGLERDDGYVDVGDLDVPEQTVQPRDQDIVDETLYMVPPEHDVDIWPRRILLLV